MKVFLTGGGTAGSVMPLLAISEKLDKAEVFFVGSKHGVEKKLVPDNITYLAMPAGKFRRYFSWQNFIDPFVIILAFFYSFGLLIKYKPQVIVSTGSFISVPMIWAAWCMGKRIIVHQQDLQVGLATKLTAPFANVLTKAFDRIKLQGAKNIGNPVRILEVTTNEIKIDKAFPTVLIFGCGSGAQAINNLVTEKLCETVNVIHITGIGKATNHFEHNRYFQYEILTEAMAEALYKADLVIARAGLSTISELSVLGKAAIIIPIPNSHQEYNANFLKEHRAAMVLKQTELTVEKLNNVILKLLSEVSVLEQLKINISKLNSVSATDKFVELIKE